MDKLFLGKKNVTLDSKGRIFMPASFDVASGTEIAFARFPGDYYQLYVLERINRIVDELLKRRDFMLNDEEYEVIVRRLNTLFDLITDTSKLDSQKRLTVPTDVKDMAEDKIILQGKGECIALFPTENSYTQYRENNLERILRI